MAQLVKWSHWAQIMISQFMNSSPVSGSALTGQSLEPASDSVSPSLSAPPQLVLSLSLSKINRGTWVAQSVKCPTSAQVMVSQFVVSSPMSGSVLTAQSLEPASDSVCVSLSLSLPCSCSASLSQK